ncbi:hypothetical protein ABBQ38_014701 [Trebouxia sp. C0009 RCD-2024]
MALTGLGMLLAAPTCVVTKAVNTVQQVLTVTVDLHTGLCRGGWSTWLTAGLLPDNVKLCKWIGSMIAWRHQA